MLGRFLEISLPVVDILASIEFYEKLGFVHAATGDSWPHPYAVLTDGRLVLGLHQSALASLTLTYVQPDLAQHATRLAAGGFVLAEEHLGDEGLNRLTLDDPAGLRVMMVEARTFSPPPEVAQESILGYFAEVGLPVRDFGAASAFWESLGFVALEETPEPFPRRTLTSNRLNIGLYRTRAFKQPVITFEDIDMKRRLDGLRRKGLDLTDEMPDSLDASTNAVLRAPEGTRLLLLNATTQDPLLQTGLQ